MSNKSGTSSQVINLPEGGGALSGIGETFAPDLHTGTGNFTVPIALPPGRNDFQPELNLVYSTGNGNSCFGLGWDLSIPGVSRKTSQGIPRYRDNSSNSADHDTYVLSGAEDLVPVQFEAGVTYYQPRTEGLFARIEHHQDNARDFWRVRSKDGLVSFYGDVLDEPLNDPATIADPNDREKLFCWKLVRTQDPFGNHIIYDYERDLDTDGIREWDQLYLKHIRYIDYDNNGSTDYLASVEFIYQDRPDPFSSYRAGFEIRTRRRCTEIIVRTHADQDRIVRRYTLVYLDQRTDLPDLPERLPVNGVSLLNMVRVEGVDETQQPPTQPLPPLEFDYTRFEPLNRRYQPLTAHLNALPERSLNDPTFEMIDLFGNGLPDIIQMNGTTRYWRNLGGGRFDLPRPMNTVPAGVTLADTGVQMADLNGDGRTDLMVANTGGIDGYYSLSFDGGWEGFMPYSQSPTINLEAPDVRLVDLDGDGMTDALRTGPSFELYYHDRDLGWVDLELIERGPPEDFPNINFDDPRVKLADMSGDDLQDIVFIHNGRIDYWPYLGYGRWGRRITMTNSPVFEDASFFPGIGFDPSRVLLGDVDGDGLADLVYVSAGHITLWLNQSGNGWSDPMTIHGTPPISNMDAVRLADMLGSGTAGVLWTYDFNSQIASTYKYLDLTGSVKPYVLNQMDNHMGAVTRVTYASSTEFYRTDAERPETRWQTPLSFPVQVVSRVEVEDHFSQGILTTEYRYHHGYWDGIEREFRGFGMVEQVDTERFARPASDDDVQFTPLLLTKTWFHQGAISLAEGGWQEADFSHEYWPGDPQILQRPDALTALLQDDTLPPRAKRDAIRSLRGRIVRTELYALDGSDRQDRPYTVTEHQFSVREERPPAVGDDQRRRSFFPTTIAQRTTQWERGDEPMTSFSFTDKYDEFGQPRRQIALAVPRRRDFRVAAPAIEPYLGTVSTTTFAPPGTRYIVDRVASSAAFEIINDGTLALFDLLQAARDGSAQLAQFAQTFNYYDGAAFEGLPPGQLGDFGALVRSESLVMTEPILRDVYRDETDPNAPDFPPYLEPDGFPDWTAEYPQEFRELTPNGAGFVFADGSDHRPRGYYAQTARTQYDFQVPTSAMQRGLPLTTRDPLGSETTITYDDFDLLPIQVSDAVGLTTRAKYDLRVLQPRLVTDPNDNSTAFVFSPLGLLQEIYVQGKDATEGDNTRPSTRFEYDFQAFVENDQPISVRTIQQEHHDTETDVDLPERDATIKTVEYSDGFGRLLQTRIQAEEILFGDEIFGNDTVPADQNDQASTVQAVAGRRNADPADPNVVVSGWQIYDNKGQVVQKYEPFFDTGWEYNPPAGDRLGQKVTMFYDPRGQVIRTLNPDGSEQRVIYGMPGTILNPDISNPDLFEPTPWEAYTYDANDLAPLSEGPLPERAPQHHHFTPANIVIDALGRTVLAVERNRHAPDPPNDPLPFIEEFHTRSTYDIRGNLLTVTDALDRVAFTYTYDLADNPLRIENIDAGVRRVILDAVANEIERRDSKGALILQAYDALHRPVRLWARDDRDSPNLPTLREVLIYGESSETGLLEAQIETANLKGMLYKHYDEAGLLTFVAYDFKGNLLEKIRQVIADEAILSVFPDRNVPNPDWNIRPFRVNWQPAIGDTLATREQELLDTTPYRISTSYDALNRVKVMVYPEDQEGDPGDQQRKRKMLRPTYNRAGALERVILSQDVNQPDGDVYVERIAYNARGQRTFIALGNGIMTRYAYDPRTFRLARLRSERYGQPNDTTYQPNGGLLQDFAYTYDLVGNIQQISDRAPGSGVSSQPDRLDRDFGYDAIYRLTLATGREHVKATDAFPWDERPKSQDVTIAQPYTESYVYDKVGNMQRLQHTAASGGFTRNFALRLGTNRLDEVTIGNNPNSPFRYTYDANGNMTGETTSRHFEWDHSDQMKAFRTQPGVAEPSIHAHYLYDAGGQRVKKLVRRQGGSFETTTYIDGVFEHHRWGSAPDEQNNHLHVMDDQSRIALVRIGSIHPNDGGPSIQFHLGDHLGSSNVVVNEDGSFINREEHTPYAETSFGSFGRKRYRFTGKERDEESGLSYHRARYYALWLARWTSCDPVGVDGGLNLYQYVRNQPLSYVDSTGMQEEEPAEAPIRKQEVNHVGVHRKQGKARRNRWGRRTTESEHIIARAKLNVLTTNPETNKPDFTNRHYRNDSTVVVERDLALNKTHELRGGQTADNPTAKKLKQRVRNGGKIDLGVDILLASIRNAKRARNAVNRARSARGEAPSSVSNAAINRAALGQVQNLFAMQSLRESGDIVNNFGSRRSRRMRSVSLLRGGGAAAASSFGHALIRTGDPKGAAIEVVKGSTPYKAKEGYEEDGTVGALKAIAINESGAYGEAVLLSFEGAFEEAAKSAGKTWLKETGNLAVLGPLSFGGWISIW